ncbi:MAG: ABC transporter permease [Clostridia bacterium]|nr:ABC transporter permease [Clostridia bacterium]
MTAFFALTKQLIKSTLKPTFKDEKEKKKYIGTLIALIVCLGIPYILMLVNIFGLVKASVELGYLAEILSIGFFMSQLLTFFFGLFKYINIMYFSKDNEFLFTLPLKSVSIFWAKFITILLYELIFSLLTVLPVCIVSIIAMATLGSFSAGILLMMFPATLLLPIMAILVIALLSYPIMKIMQFFKSRPILGAVMTVIFVVAIYVAIYLPVLLNTPNVDGSEIASGAADGAGTGVPIGEMYAMMLPSIAPLGKYFYHTYLLAMSMTVGGVKAFGYAMAFIGIVAVLAALGTLLAMWQFKRISQGVYENNGATASSKKQKEVKQTSLKKALVKKEFSSVLKSSNLLVQSGMMVILPPVLIFFLGTMQVKMNNSFVGLAIAELIIKLMTSSNTISILAVSRDGEGALMAKTMPISANQIVWSKIFVGFVFSAITVVLSTVAFAFIGGVNVLQVLGFFLSNIIYAWSVNRFCVYRDLKKPRVHWKNIEEIIKNNFASVIPMFLAFIPGLLVMIPTMVYGIVLMELNPYAVGAAYLATTLLISGIYYLIVRGLTKVDVEELWNRIE